MSKSTLFDELCNATTAQAILNALIAAVWKKDGNEGEPPAIPTVEALVEYDAYKLGSVIYPLVENLNTAQEIFGKTGPIYQTPELREACDRIIDTVAAEDNFKRTLFDTVAAFGFVDVLIADFAERIERLHSHWQAVIDRGEKIPHILAPIVREWLKWSIEQTAKPITKEYDRTHPVSVLKHPLGSVRELAFTERDLGQVFKAPERIDQIQMELNLGDTPSVLPAIMPLQVVRTTNLKPQTRSGAVSHELRIFFEAMMALEPKLRRADLMFRLGDLIDFLYPNGKFHWTNQMPHIENALGVLNTNATVPWIDDQGDLREWTPVVIPSLLPNKPTRDTPIFVQVTMPPDAEQGYLVIKNVGRLKGMKSSAGWNAYHVACYLWDKHATIKGVLIDPTRPIDRRNEKGEIVDKDGVPILTARGTPITYLYHDRVIAQGDREENPAADRYPVLSSEDLILACFPNGYAPSARREYLKRAKAHWRQMEVDGDITIKPERSGLRILPTAKHLNAYRALDRAKKAVY